MPHEQDVKAIETALGLFASAIKSGERWTGHCGEAQSAALDALDRICATLKKSG